MMSGRKLLLAVAALLALLLAVLVPTGTAAAATPSTVVSRGATTSKMMALTFDVGSDVGNLATIVATLADKGVTSTFFVTGEVATDNPAAIRSVTAAGHEIGNHSYSHPVFTGLTAAQIADQLSRAATAIQTTTGLASRPFFRPPEGAYDSAVLQAVGEAGYPHTIMWTIDTIDWQGPSSSVIRDRVVSRAVPGAIVLMHAGAGAPGTPGALPGMIDSLRAAGYQLVTVSQLLGLTTGPAYTVVAGDTLYRIALRYGVTVPALAAANGITNINLINVGQVLTIPTGTTPTPPPPAPPPPPPPTTVRYTVQAGDNLYRIALRYGVTVAALAAANGITNVSYIRVGQVLVIPAR